MRVVLFSCFQGMLVLPIVVHTLKPSETFGFVP
jgi:hypothetical protein